jgi:hypothetical protein
MQVVAEVVAADDITEVDRLAEYQARPVRHQEGPEAAGPGAGPPAPVMASRDSSSQLAQALRVPRVRQNCIWVESGFGV